MVRPVTLRVLAGLLSRIESEDRIRIDGLSVRQREVLRVLLSIGAAHIDSDGYVSLTSEGREFLRAYRGRDPGRIHRLFYDHLEEYRRVYEYCSNGVLNPKRIVEETGLNFLVVDNILRLIHEIDLISSDASTSIMDLDALAEIFVEEYRRISSRTRNKYVKLSDIERSMNKRIFLPRKTFQKLLSYIRRKYRGRIVFAGAPFTGSGKGYVVDGKRIVLVMIR